MPMPTVAKKEPHATWEMAIIADSILNRIRVSPCRTASFEEGDDEDDEKCKVSLAKASSSIHDGYGDTKTNHDNMDLRYPVERVACQINVEAAEK